VLAILNHGGGGGGTVEYGGDGGIRRILFLIRWITLRSAFVSSSSSPRGDEIKGLVSGPLFPSFL